MKEDEHSPLVHLLAARLRLSARLIWRTKSDDEDGPLDDTFIG